MDNKIETTETTPNKDKWIELDFVGQSKWTTEHLNLPKERFKLVTWRD